MSNDKISFAGLYRYRHDDGRVIYIDSLGFHEIMPLWRSIDKTVGRIMVSLANRTDLPNATNAASADKISGERAELWYRYMRAVDNHLMNGNYDSPHDPCLNDKAIIALVFSCLYHLIPNRINTEQDKEEIRRGLALLEAPLLTQERVIEELEHLCRDPVKAQKFPVVSFRRGSANAASL